MDPRSFQIKKPKLKLPILNNHKCEGIYNSKGWFPIHYCWIPHLILGLLSIRYVIIIPIFVLYQVSQMITKREYWDDIVDLIEFYIGYKYLIIILCSVFSVCLTSFKLNQTD